MPQPAVTVTDLPKVEMEKKVAPIFPNLEQKYLHPSELRKNYKDIDVILFDDYCDSILVPTGRKREHEVPKIVGPLASISALMKKPKNYKGCQVMILYLGGYSIEEQRDIAADLEDRRDAKKENISYFDETTSQTNWHLRDAYNEKHWLTKKEFPQFVIAILIPNLSVHAHEQKDFLHREFPNFFLAPAHTISETALLYKRLYKKSLFENWYAQSSCESRHRHHICVGHQSNQGFAFATPLNMPNREDIGLFAIHKISR